MAAWAGSVPGLAKRVVVALDVRTNDAGDLVVTKGDQYDVREGGTAAGGEVRAERCQHRLVARADFSQYVLYILGISASCLRSMSRQHSVFQLLLVLKCQDVAKPRVQNAATRGSAHQQTCVDESNVCRRCGIWASRSR